MRVVFDATKTEYGAPKQIVLNYHKMLVSMWRKKSKLTRYGSDNQTDSEEEAESYENKKKRVGSSNLKHHDLVIVSFTTKRRLLTSSISN